MNNFFSSGDFVFYLKPYKDRDGEFYSLARVIGVGNTVAKLKYLCSFDQHGMEMYDHPENFVIFKELSDLIVAGESGQHKITAELLKKYLQNRTDNGNDIITYSINGILI